MKSNTNIILKRTFKRICFDQRNMKEQYKQQIEYLCSLIDSVQYIPDAFTIYQNDDKYIFGITSIPGVDVPLAKILEYKTLYDTLLDLDGKIKYSLNTALEYAYFRSVLVDFNPMKQPEGEEWMAYYYIENAAFRTSSMWDILAQFYRVRYDIAIAFDKVYYKKIFDPSKGYCTEFQSIAEAIHAYIKEKNNTDCDDAWKGNHGFMDEYRNKMTHRNSPNVTVASDLDLNFKHHPTFILKRLVEDYVQAFRFISDILKEATKESRQIFNDTID